MTDERPPRSPETEAARDRAPSHTLASNGAIGRGPSEGSEPALVEALREEIARGGPITFARFMEVALYDPRHGYYATSGSRPTRSGDFLTAPELHPVFGRCLGRQIAECWERLGRPDGFTLREYAAGSGILATTVLRGLRADGSPLAERLRYEPVEIDERRRGEVVAHLRAEGLADRLVVPAEPLVGVVLANELLDALPVHRVEGSADGLRELYVDWDGERFVDRLGPPADPTLESRLEAEGVRLAPGQRGEVRPTIDAWLDEVSGGLERGYVVVIDYGRPARELYATTRWAGTLLAYQRHRIVDDPYANVGRQDLTAHVDLTALERAAVAASLTVEGTTTQAEFLTGLGLGDLLTEGAGRTTDEMLEYLELRAAAIRLLDPRHLGGFAVMILGRDAPAGPPLRGLEVRIQRGGGA